MIVDFHGDEFSLDPDGEYGEPATWADLRVWAAQRATSELFLAESVFRRDDETAVTGRARERLVAWFEGRYDHLPKPLTFDQAPPPGDRRWLIPGLQPFGTIPMLGGPPKAGKTSVAIDYAAALLLPGYRFLNHFDPATLTDKEKDRHVWVINAETPAEDFEAALTAVGFVRPEPGDDLESWSSCLHVVHLEQLGGAFTFDLTNPHFFDMWAQHFITCDECIGEDDADPPIAVIADGLTAILGGSTERYGQWYAAFRTLLRTLDIPSGLVTGHNTLEGGHLMGGVAAQAGADGLWNYTRRGQDSHDAKRYFGVIPRIGGVPFGPTRVDVVKGRLTIQASHHDESETNEEPAPTSPDLNQLVLDFVAAANAKHEAPSVREIRSGVRGTGADVSAAKDALVEAGLLVALPRKKKGGGHAYWIADVPVPPVAMPPDAAVI